MGSPKITHTHKPLAGRQELNGMSFPHVRVSVQITSSVNSLSASLHPFLLLLYEEETNVTPQHPPPHHISPTLTCMWRRDAIANGKEGENKESEENDGRLSQWMTQPSATLKRGRDPFNRYQRPKTRRRSRSYVIIRSRSPIKCNNKEKKEGVVDPRHWRPFVPIGSLGSIRELL